MFYLYNYPDVIEFSEHDTEGTHMKKSIDLYFKLILLSQKERSIKCFHLLLLLHLCK